MFTKTPTQKTTTKKNYCYFGAKRAAKRARDIYLKIGSDLVHEENK
jgi:hypothetical protein